MKKTILSISAIPSGTHISVLAVLFAIFVLILKTAPGLFADSSRASAQIMNRQGRNIGSAEFSEVKGVVKIRLNLSGLEPGIYSVHIHEKGLCASPDFASAGRHFNPEEKMHGFLNRQGPHAGDLPNFIVNDDGKTETEFRTELISLKKGEVSSIMDEPTSIVIHSQADDYVTDPAGNSGDRIACGPIKLYQ